MVSPLVSVVMTVYNGEMYLREAIQSILRQTFTDFEFIIVDDGSTDSSLQIIQEYRDERIKIIALPENIGISGAKNRGIEIARGKYFAVQDADDISLPHRLEEQVAHLEQRNGTTAVFAFIDLIDVYGAPCGVWPDDRKNITAEDIRRTLPRRNCLAHPTAMIRTAWLRENRFPEGFNSTEDHALWLNAMNQNCVFEKIPQALVLYRIHPSSATSTSNANPRLKVSQFRKRYLQLRREKGQLSAIDRQILFYHRMEPFYWFMLKWMHQPIHKALHFIHLNPLRIAYEFIRVFIQLSTYHKKPDIIFFFPFHQIGGAEKVHLSIVQLFSNYRTLILFTKKSDNDGFIQEFQKLSDCIFLSELPRYPFFGKIIQRKLADLMTKNANALLLGSNSKAYYQALALLQHDVKAIDLFHAFVHPKEQGAEHWSLAVADKLKTRIFISEDAMHRMTSFYREHGISPELVNRFKLIRNYTATPSDYTSRTMPCRAIYIGRSTPEKRIHLLFKIAEAIHERNPSFHLDIVGDIAPSAHAFITFHGVMRDEEKIRKLIRSCHILFLTSYREGLPMVVLEAMSEGCVPIVTAVGDLPNVIHNEKNGFLLPVYDEETIVEQAVSITEKLFTNSLLAEAMGRESMQTTKENFSYEKFRLGYLSLMNENES